MCTSFKKTAGIENTKLRLQALVISSRALFPAVMDGKNLNQIYWSRN
jgi:hypothetical protein